VHWLATLPQEARTTNSISAVYRSQWDSAGEQLQPTRLGTALVLAQEAQVRLALIMNTRLSSRQVLLAQLLLVLSIVQGVSLDPANLAAGAVLCCLLLEQVWEVLPLLACMSVKRMKRQRKKRREAGPPRGPGQGRSQDRAEIAPVVVIRI